MQPLTIFFPFLVPHLIPPTPLKKREGKLNNLAVPIRLLRQRRLLRPTVPRLRMRQRRLDLWRKLRLLPHRLRLWILRARNLVHSVNRLQQRRRLRLGHGLLDWDVLWAKCLSGAAGVREWAGLEPEEKFDGYDGEEGGGWN